MDKMKYMNYETGFMPILILTNHDEDCPLHNHDYTELVIVLSGKGLHLTETVNYPINTGDIFVIHKNQHHGYQNTNNLTIAIILFRYDDFFKDNDDFESIPKFRTLSLQDFSRIPFSRNQVIFQHQFGSREFNFGLIEMFN